VTSCRASSIASAIARTHVACEREQLAARDPSGCGAKQCHPLPDGTPAGRGEAAPHATPAPPVARAAPMAIARSTGGILIASRAYTVGCGGAA
jgi:hypothetical protein